MVSTNFISNLIRPTNSERPVETQLMTANLLRIADSLNRPVSSLFLKLNSLFRENNSLFGGVGNLPINPP